MSVRDAHIYDHARTPRGPGRSDVGLALATPVLLAARVLSELMRRSGLPADTVDDVVLGCVAPVGQQGSDIARSAVLLVGLGESVAGVQLNRFCGSGLEAVGIAAAKVVAGYADLCIAGGVESMSRIPMGSDGGAWYTDPEVALAAGFVPQGVSAEPLATLPGHSRSRLDAWALHTLPRGEMQVPAEVIDDQGGDTVTCDILCAWFTPDRQRPVSHNS